MANLLSPGNNLSADRLVCITNLHPDITEHDLREHFLIFGPIKSVSVYEDIKCGYIIFQNVDSYNNCIKSGRQQINKHRYPLKTYNQMAANLHKRFDLTNLSGRWKSRVVRLFDKNSSNGSNSPTPSSNSTFYVDIAENNSSSSQIDQNNISNTLEIEDQPCSSRDIQEMNKRNTISYIDENNPTARHFNVPSTNQKNQKNQKNQQDPQDSQAENKTSQSSTKSSTKSSKKSTNGTPKNFKQKTRVVDDICAKDLLIEELRIHLNMLSGENQALLTEKLQTNEQLSRQTAENFELIEENQRLYEENSNYMAMLREKLETQRYSYPIEMESPFQDCCVCMVNKSNCVLNRCGHVCLCNHCASLFQQNENMCPVCRQDVESVIRIYM